MQYKNSFSVFHMKYNLTGLVAAVRDSISACVIQMLLVDCNGSAQIISLCLPPCAVFFNWDLYAGLQSECLRVQMDW